MTTPIRIELHEQDHLEIEWNDGKIFKYPLKFLRDESPDAGNKGETILWKHYAPPPKGPEKPGMYEIESITAVGNYAIQIRWKDGYDYGIYSWEVLRKFGEYLELKDNLYQDFENH